jgi:hypothetical protein
MEKFQKPSNSVCYAPSSESFRIYTVSIFSFEEEDKWLVSIKQAGTRILRYILKERTLHNDSCEKLTSKVIILFYQTFKDGGSSSCGRNHKRPILLKLSVLAIFAHIRWQLILILSFSPPQSLTFIIIIIIIMQIFNRYFNIISSFHVQLQWLLPGRVMQW